MKKKIVCMMTIFGMMAAAFTGCGSKDSESGASSGSGSAAGTAVVESGAAGGEEKNTVIMAGNPFVGMAPIYVAMEKGFFQECGLEFSLVNFDDSSASCSALISGKADAAYSTLDAAIIAESSFDENKMKIISVVDESAGADGILATNDIAGIADLKGKNVGVTLNQTSHYLLLQALEKEGLTDADVNLVDMTASDAGVSFISGGLDAAVTWEPYLSNAVNSGAGKLLFSSADAPGSIMDILAVRAEDAGADWVEKMNQAYQMGLTI